MSMYPIQSWVNSGTATNTVTFNNISQEFKHLQIRLSVRINAPGNNNWYADFITFNGDNTGSNYDTHALQAYATVGGGGQTLGSGLSSSLAALNNSLMEGGVSTSYTTVSITDILDYTNTNKNKVGRSIYGFITVPTPLQVGMFSFIWKSTAAITSLTISNPIAAWTAASRIDLYGISTSNATGA
jgi:hypothetical protein